MVGFLLGFSPELQKTLTCPLVWMWVWMSLFRCALWLTGNHFGCPIIALGPRWGSELQAPGVESYCLACNNIPIKHFMRQQTFVIHPHHKGEMSQVLLVCGYYFATSIACMLLVNVFKLKLCWRSHHFCCHCTSDDLSLKLHLFFCSIFSKISWFVYCCIFLGQRRRWCGQE